MGITRILGRIFTRPQKMRTIVGTTPAAQVGQTTLGADIEATMVEGRRIFPVSDYGYLGWLKDPKSVIIYKNYEGPFYQGPAFILTFSPWREMTPEGRFGPGFDCFDSSAWLFQQLTTKGYLPSMVVLENPPIFGSDYAVSLKGNLLSLTPGFDQANNYRVTGGIPSIMVAHEYAKRGGLFSPLGPASVIMKYEATDGDAIVYWFKARLVDEAEQQQILLSITADLIRNKERTASVKIEVDLNQIGVYALRGYELGEGKSYLKDGQYLKPELSYDRPGWKLSSDEEQALSLKTMDVAAEIIYYFANRIRTR